MREISCTQGERAHDRVRERAIQTEKQGQGKINIVCRKNTDKVDEKTFFCYLS